ncbi:MAG: serine/threonine protein kinase [Planctomycetales bacterium]|nr:serine/threonine protein kinase [Planctomycetales bacterium]
MPDTRLCPTCGTPIPSGSPAGLCPKCLLHGGIDSQSEVDPNLTPTRHSPVAGASGFLPPSIEELAGRFPQLEFLELLGRGGMGAVYKARQRGLDRLVAVKILPPEIGHDAAFAERFTREARALARLSHNNIVSVYDFGVVGSGIRENSGDASEFSRIPLQDRLCYIVMEFVDGANLRQAIQTKTLTPAEALAIVPQICEALQFAHDEGIVHRDIKPENILIDKRGRVKIADFGLAKLLGQDASDQSLTATHQVMGTLRYMAPEQMQGSREVDHRADIYSLGVVFYELLTGELPMGKFAPPSKKVQVDVRLDEVVLRALEQEPEQRYQHASEVKTDVEEISRSGVAGVQSLRPHPRAGEPVDRLRDLANFWMSPQPGFGKWVGWPMLVLLAMWMVATAAVHVVFGQKGNYREGPILFVQGGGMVLLPLAFFALLAYWSASQRVVSDTARRPVHSSSWSTIEITTAVAVGIAFALAAVKGIFELAQRGSPLDNISMFVTAAATVAVVVLLVLQQLGRTNGLLSVMPGFCIAVLAACAGSLPWTAVFSPIAGWLFWQGAVFATLNFLLVLGLLIAGDARPRTRAISLLLVGLISFGLVMLFDLGPVGVIGSNFLGKITHKPGLPGEFIAAALSLLAMIAGALQLRTEMSEEAHTEAVQPIRLSNEPRFSRFAIAGAVWALFGVLAVIPTLYFIGLNRVWNGTALPTDVIHSEPPLVFSIFMGALLAIGSGAPIGTTIYGAIAIGHIKRSGGKIIGLPLAVADVLFFPLLVLSGLIAALVAQVVYSMAPHSNAAAVTSAGAFGVLVALVVCFFVARAVWLAVAGRPAQPQATARTNETTSSVETIATEPRLSRCALVGAIWAPLLCLAGVVLWVAQNSQSYGPGEYTGPAWWLLALMFTVLPLGVLAPFGTTILGAVGIAKIKRSEGKLYGLRLAQADALLFPLLVLGAAAGLAGFLLLRGPLRGLPPISSGVDEWFYQSPQQEFVTLLIALPIWFFPARALFRAVVGPRDALELRKLPLVGDEPLTGKAALVVALAAIAAHVWPWHWIISPPPSQRSMTISNFDVIDAWQSFWLLVLSIGLALFASAASLARPAKLILRVGSVIAVIAALVIQVQFYRSLGEYESDKVEKVVRLIRTYSHMGVYVTMALTGLAILFFVLRIFDEPSQPKAAEVP